MLALLVGVRNLPPKIPPLLIRVVYWTTAPTDGTGQFKFVLVTSTNLNLTATATHTLSGGFNPLYTVNSGGIGYLVAPPVTILAVVALVRRLTPPSAAAS